MEIRDFQEIDTEGVVALWEACGLVTKTNNPHKDIERKLQVNPELLLVGVVDAQVAATVMGGYEGHRGWINYLAVDPIHQGKGLAKALMHEIEGRLAALGCPKINLQVRTSNTEVLQFYRSIGYLDDDVISLGKRLVHDV